MVENPPHHNRRSIRLQGYNYSSEGGYFITIVTHKRQRLFGEIVNGEMRLNSFGLVVRGEWLRTAELRPYVELFEDEFIVMPNPHSWNHMDNGCCSRGVLQYAPTYQSISFTRCWNRCNRARIQIRCHQKP